MKLQPFHCHRPDRPHLTRCYRPIAHACRRPCGNWGFTPETQRIVLRQFGMYDPFDRPKKERQR